MSARSIARRQPGRAIDQLHIAAEPGRGNGALIDDSIRVIETNADGTQVIDEDVPFQFDKASNFNATTNASGTLVFVVKGNTSASATRNYHVYFDTAGSFTPFSFSSQVSTDANSSDEGQDAIKITTNSATYWLQKENGGFSSIEDVERKRLARVRSDASGSQSGGEYRGTPNMVFPGGGFHPGFDNGTTTIVNSGPLKTTIETTRRSTEQRWRPFTYTLRYEIFGDYVRRHDGRQRSDNYWFLYEGTPGGALDGNDTVVRSDGTITSINTSWTDNDGLGSGNGEEWAVLSRQRR